VILSNSAPRAISAALLLAAVAAMAHTNPPGPSLDPARDPSGLHRPAHALLPEQYIWTAGDAAALRPDHAKFTFRDRDRKTEPHAFRGWFTVGRIPAAATIYIAGPPRNLRLERMSSAPAYIPRCGLAAIFLPSKLCAAAAFWRPATRPSSSSSLMEKHWSRKSFRQLHNSTRRRSPSRMESDAVLQPRNQAGNLPPSTIMPGLSFSLSARSKAHPTSFSGTPTPACTTGLATSACRRTSGPSPFAPQPATNGSKL